VSGTPVDAAGNVRMLSPRRLPPGDGSEGRNMKELREDQLLTIVKNVVEQNGCTLVEIDFEKHILNIDGPEEAQARCAIALQDVLG
jgi:hypothetical protein